MTLFTGLVLYLLIWWTALFAVLPFGLKPHGNLELGTAGSAPENPGLKKKFLITTAVAALAWLAVYGLIRAEVFSFREAARQMAQADRAADGHALPDGLEKSLDREKTGESDPP